LIFIIEKEGPLPIDYLEVTFLPPEI